MGGLFEKGLLAGLGLLELSQEKVGEVIDELVERGEMSRKEGSRVAQNVIERGMEEKERLEKRVRAAVESALGKMSLATRTDLESLEKRLSKLERRFVPGKGGSRP